jgi:hypothetical protein
LSAPSRSPSLPCWAALGPRAHPRRRARWSFRARPLGRQARQRPRRVVARPGPSHPPATSDPQAQTGLPARSAAERGRRLTPSATRPRSATGTLPYRSTHDLCGVACVQASAAVDGAARARGRPHGTRPTPAVKALPDRRGQGPRRADPGRDGRHRTDGRTPDGWTPDGADAGRADAGRADRPILDGRTRRPDTRGSDTGRLDTRTGRGTGPGGHPMVDRTGSGRYGGHLGLPDYGDALRRDTAQKLRRTAAAWGGQQRGQLRRRRPCRGLATAMPRPS